MSADVMDRTRLSLDQLEEIGATFTLSAHCYRCGYENCLGDSCRGWSRPRTTRRTAEIAATLLITGELTRWDVDDFPVIPVSHLAWTAEHVAYVRMLAAELRHRADVAEAAGAEAYQARVRALKDERARLRA